MKALYKEQAQFLPNIKILKLAYRIVKKNPGIQVDTAVKMAYCINTYNPNEWVYKAYQNSSTFDIVKALFYYGQEVKKVIPLKTKIGYNWFSDNLEARKLLVSFIKTLHSNLNKPYTDDWKKEAFGTKALLPRSVFNDPKKNSKNTKKNR